MGEWQPIETAPKADVVVLTDGDALWQGCWQEGYGWITGYYDSRTYVVIVLEPTHWQPLPAGPTKASAKPDYRTITRG